MRRNGGARWYGRICVRSFKKAINESGCPVIVGVCGMSLELIAQPLSPILLFVSSPSPFFLLISHGLSVFSARTVKHAYLLAALTVVVLVAVRHLPPPYEVDEEELAAASATLIASLNIHALDIDTLSLETAMGPCLVVETPLNKNITTRMKGLAIPRGVNRVVFKTLNTDKKLMAKGEFDSSYTGFTVAQYLAANTDVEIVAIIQVEGLKLHEVAPGAYC
ncbi:hypothetical protein DM860_011638 [Cuscuta australis]|uniref:Uncharacterized protein n=1 Tax=Cuscuta australis TaxID=267555 RepID=A0A328DJM8_9ASTE|nr:hypothetical protein DM860_011638 [Cuscuta australis]